MERGPGRVPQTAQERAVLLLKAALLPGWHPNASQVLVWSVRGAVVLGIMVPIAFAVDKPLWDWLELLVVPVVLAVGGYLFNSSQNRRNQADAKEQRELDRYLSEEGRQDESLQKYLDSISDMLLDPSRPLHKARLRDSLSLVARSRTLPVLRRLDTGRKRIIMQFLYEAGLITNHHLVIDLERADLSNAGLNELHLEDAHLAGVGLIGASLNGAALEGACLRRAWIDVANLRTAKLVGADLRGASLENADLRGADLSRADLRPESSDPDIGVNLRGANLSAARLRNAHLEGADLRGAIMHPAELEPPEDPNSEEAFLHKEYYKDADLKGANLSGADLRGALISRDQLAECGSLKDATMPDRQKYEDWLKSKSH